MKRNGRFKNSLLTCITVLLLGYIVAGPHQAAATSADAFTYATAEQPDDRIAAQLTVQLNSPHEGVRETTIRNIITLAEREGSQQVDLKGTTRGLLHIFQTEENEKLRLMAVQALHSIGDSRAMSSLHRLLRQDGLKDRADQFALYAIAAQKHSSNHKPV